MTDLHFNKILLLLRKIHKDMPDLRFGEVIQVALDRSKRSGNINLFNVSSKIIHKALTEYHGDEKGKRGKS